MTERTAVIEGIRSSLHHRRDDLIGRLKRELDEEAALVAEPDPNSEDLAARHGPVGVLDRISERDLHELARIDAALRRIDEGGYGRCKACGDAIAIDRLLALPDADECTDCAEREEAAAAL